MSGRLSLSLPAGRPLLWAALALLAALPLAAPAAAQQGGAATGPRRPPAARVTGPHAPGWERGLPYFTSRFGPRDYDAHMQNWAVAQTPDGVVWVGNTTGLLRYDGVHWRHVSLPGGAAGTVRSLSVDARGRLFIGGVGTFGYVGADSVGAPRYIELAGPATLSDDDVWATVAAGGDVFFQTFTHLYRFDGRNVRVAATAGATEGMRFHKVFGVARPDGTTLYVREEGVGLLRYDRTRAALVPVPGGGAYAVTKVFALLPGRNGGLIVGTPDHLEVLDARGTVRPLPMPAVDAVLQEYRLYDAADLGGGRFALGTLGAGIYVVDRDGRTLAHYGEEVLMTGDDYVLDLAVDEAGGMWAATSNGVVRFDVMAPLTVFNERQGLPGQVYHVMRHRGTVYAATETGVYRLVPGEGAGAAAAFASTGLREQSWVLYSDGERLLAATSGGLFEVFDEGAPRQILEGTAYVVQAASGTGTVLVGTAGGLAVLRRGPDGWAQYGDLIDVGGEVRTLAEENGTVWVGRPDLGVVALRTLPSGELREVARYTRHGAFAENIRGIAIITPDAAYRPTAGGRLVADRALTRIVRTLDSTRAFYLTEDVRGRLWAVQGERVRVYQRRSGGAAWVDVTPPVLRTLRDGFRMVSVEGDVIWVGTEHGVLRLDGRDASVVRYAVAPHVSFTGVTTADRGILWAGGARGAGTTPELHVRSTAGPVRIEFAAATFNDPAATRYRTRLAGFDDEWSVWSLEPWREYTNLPPGSYTFEVEAINAHGVLSHAATLALEVEPRWSQTWWARGALALALLALVVAGAASRVRVHRRTAEAERRRADEFARLNERLEEADRLKDEFLTNASHELRTPLTAVLGYADLLSEYGGEEEPADVRLLAGHIRNGGERLLRTVEDIMDVAALRAGRAALDLQRVDVAAVARAAATDARPAAEAKGLPLVVLPDGVTAPVMGDARALARVLNHLLSNAIKFTDGGSIRVLVDPRSGEPGAEFVEVSVADTGCGIGADFLPRLFDEFAQESTGIARSFEGNGLGLSVVKRLTVSMGGTVRAESTPGQGTTVRLRFPRAVEPTPEPTLAPPTAAPRAAPDAPRVNEWAIMPVGASDEEPFSALFGDGM